MLKYKFNAKVFLTGAGGGIGQPLSLLLKCNPLVTSLALYDVVDINGVALDLSHINTKAKIFVHDDTTLDDGLKAAELVVIAAGKPRKKGMSRDDLFRENAKIVESILSHIVLEICPKIAIITNPLNSIVPFAFEYLHSRLSKMHTSTLHQRIFGVTTLDTVRASTFYADYLGKDPTDVIVPVIGGHSETTMIPLFSMSNYPLNDESVASRLTQNIREAGTKLLEAHYGKPVNECAFVASPVNEGLSYFSQIVTLQLIGRISTISFDKINSYENKLLHEILPYLKTDVNKGIEYAQSLIK
ncbi:hypothetical protein HZS_4686 [Henneguya salminicola]|nr:hypothetical protein HZS_4686 [Henneguya salminicola]